MVKAETKVIDGFEQNTTPPSTLHLFRYKSLEFANLQKRVPTVLQLEASCGRTEFSLGKLHAATNARLDRLSQTGKELSEQLDNTESSIACGAVYLKMRSELPNLSPKDFMEFFNLCLTFNTIFNEQIKDNLNTKGEQATLLNSVREANARRIPTEYVKILDTIIHNPPEWYQSNKKAWRLFVLSHANFAAYLKADFVKDLATRPSSIIKEGIVQLSEASENFYGFTKQGEFPDWLLEGSETLPAKEEVEEELAEDKEQQIKTTNALEKIKEQKNYLITTSADKTQKAIARLLDFVKETFPNIQNFADMILFLEIAHKTRIFTVLFEKAITDYTQPQDILKISEPIALYIEKKLLEGMIIQSAQEPIDAHFIDVFSAAFESIKAQQRDGSKAAEFEALRTTDKKAFGALNYDIKPFLEVLSGPELSFLQDLLQDSNGKPTELFIWDIAELVSSAFKGIQEEELGKSQRGAIHYLQKFMSSFLRNHSKFAYGELTKSSQDNLQEQEKLKPEDSLATAHLQEEVESTTEELAQANLAGWHIFYTDNKSSDEKHLKEIGGKTLEERELALQEFFLKQGISASVKPGSIIRALDWLVTVPENIEQLRIRKDIGGEIFKKLKRANLRIFYRMVSSEKKFIFFVHQKQAWNYGF